MNDTRKLHASNTLLIGFDSAWTRKNRGAIVGVVLKEDGTFRELGQPRIVNFTEATGLIFEWQSIECPNETIVLLDQPTIVTNAVGQRPAENIAASPVSLRYGGMQPANIGRVDMFGSGAPVWQFLKHFGGPADPLNPNTNSLVFETYPVLAMIALNWALPDKRITGRLPKYNPERRKTFSIDDWRYVCNRLFAEFTTRQLSELGAWINEVMAKPLPRKKDQDSLDACICLLVALYLIESKGGLMIGDTNTGYIVVPQGNDLQRELEERCRKTNRDPSLWVRSFPLNIKEFYESYDALL